MTMRRASAARRLGACGLLMLLIASIVLSAVTYQLLHSMRESSDSARAELLAASVAQRVEHALSVGIPLTELEGMEAFFQHRMHTHADIDSIALVHGDDNGKVLWSARQPGSGAADNNGTQTAIAPVHQASQQVASVRLTLRPGDFSAFARNTAVLLLPVVAMLSALAFLAARIDEAQGPLLRNHATRLAMRAIRNGRFDRAISIVHRKEHDLRVQTLAHATRIVHETMARVRRLIASLRVTEPQSVRREQLDQLLAQAEGDDRFAPDGLIPVRVVAAQAQAFWACLLVSITSMALAQVFSASFAWHMSLHMPVFFAGSCVGALCAQRLRLRAFSQVMGACVALCILATSKAVGMLDAIPAMAASLGALMVCAITSGIALQACMGVQSQASRGTSQWAARPLWPAASLGAWMMALLWFAPALAAVTQAAFGPHVGSAALALPLICCMVQLIQWSVPRSPWRALQSTPLRNNAQARRPSPTHFATCAAGVIAVMYGVRGLTALPSLWALTAIGLGLLTGLRATAHPSRRAAVVTLMSTLLWSAAHWLALDAAVVTTLASLVLGWAIASALKSEARGGAMLALPALASATAGALVATALPAWCLPALAGCLTAAGLWFASTKKDSHAA